ncbi:18290_t:CDS:2, partial [Racocetra fulgida]
SSQEHRESDAEQKHRKRATETAEQCQLRQQADASAHRQLRTNRAEERYLHQNQHDAITHLSNTNCTYCNALKLLTESPGMCCSNGKVVLAELNIPPLLNHLFSTVIIRANIPGLDLRTYNASTASQVAAVWIDDEVPSNVIQKRDIVLHINMDQLIHISEFNRYYDPLAYPILFLYGEQGWSPCQIPYRGVSLIPDDNNIENSDLDDEINEVSNDDNNDNSEPETNQTRNNENSSVKKRRKFVSTMEFYAYKIQIRPQSTNLLIQSGRLFQQFIVDMYVKIEANRLNFYQQNQNKIRCDLYKGLQDAVLHKKLNELKKDLLEQSVFSKFRMPSQLQALFVTLLIFGDIADVRQLWNENFDAMSEDFMHRGIPNGQPLIQTTLQSLNILLQKHSKTVTEFDLSDLLYEIIETELSTVLIEELSYNFTIADLNKANILNEAQRTIFDETLSLIEHRKSG